MFPQCYPTSKSAKTNQLNYEHGQMRNTAQNMLAVGHHRQHSRSQRHQCRFHSHLPLINPYKTFCLSPYNTSHQTRLVPSLDSLHNFHHLRSATQVPPSLPTLHSPNFIHLPPTLLAFWHNHLQVLHQIPYHTHQVICQHITMAPPSLNHQVVCQCITMAPPSLNHFLGHTHHPTLTSMHSTCKLGGLLLLQVSQSVGLTILKSDQHSVPSFHGLNFHLEKHCQDPFYQHSKVAFVVRHRRRQGGLNVPFSVMAGLG